MNGIRVVLIRGVSAIESADKKEKKRNNNSNKDNQQQLKIGDLNHVTS